MDKYGRATNLPSDSAGKLYLHPDEGHFLRFLDARLTTVGITRADTEPYWAAALQVTEARFRSIKNKYYQKDDLGFPLRAAHLGHTILFLYELSRQAWMASNHHLADLLYFLNAASGCNILYEVKIPLRTFCDHPHGAVIGRADFSIHSAFSFSTNCTIGNSNNIYPSIDGGLVMLPNSAILGSTDIRGNVVMSNGSKLLDAGEVRDVVVYGTPPHNTYRPLSLARYDEICNFKA